MTPPHASTASAERAAALGADALGFVFAPSSRRADPALLRELRGLDVPKVAVVVSERDAGRVRLPDSAHAEHTEIVRVLGDRADYLYQTADNLREGVLSVIELHLNVVSFEMNKVMRLLAVVSVLGLAPAVVGGLLGMNLSGNPWPVTLWQVTFGVCGAVLLILYTFLVRGWLR